MLQPRLTAAAPATRPLLATLLVIGFAVLICLRLPDAVLHGRMWAEEGRDFYLHAATMPWTKALMLPFGGYVNLVANAAPIIARWLVPLEGVPWVTMGIGLLFQCCPAILLVISRDAWLRRPAALVAALLIIATPPLTEEVWLHTLHSQFHLALCCALILALDVPARGTGLFRAAVLFFAPLCGPSPAVLLPLFLARAGLERSRARLVQTAILGAGTVLQITVFYTHEAGRSYGIGPVVLLCVVYIKQIVVPLLGRIAGDGAGMKLQAQFAAGIFPLKAVLITLAGFGAFWAVLLWQRFAAPAWMLVAGCLFAWIAYFGAINGGLRLLIIGESGRYSFLPVVLTGLALVALAANPAARGGPAFAWAARAGVVWLVLVGIWDLPRSGDAMAHGPRWLDEVALWRADHSHPIAIWPDGWSMRLAHE